MSGEPDGFLARWSRRKTEVRREEARPPAPEALPPAAEPEPELTPEEIAALPRIEELTPETDITAFLRKGVPEALKNAALRRMWSLDPAIRDYVGDARDYAYDWNVPGGVPGNGPLLPTDDVGAMLRRLFPEERPATELAEAPGEAVRVSSQPREPAPPAEGAQGGREEGGPVQGDADRAAAGDGDEGADAPDALPPPARERSGVPPLQVDSGTETAQIPPRRRHGGASPV